jgi:hypothetical protein
MSLWDTIDKNLRAQSESNKISKTSKPEQSSMANYLQAFNKLKIHKLLKDVLEQLPIPEHDTTLADIYMLQEKLNRAEVEIRETEQELRKIFTYVEKTDRLIKQKNLVKEYFKHTVDGCGQLKLMLQNQNSRELNTTRNAIVERLSQIASQVDNATVDLILS